MFRAFAVLCLSLVPLLAAAEDTKAVPGPTAKALSYAMVAAAKAAVIHGSPDAQVDHACIRAIDDHALAPGYEGVLRRQLGTSYRAEADRFYATPAGMKSAQYAVHQRLVSQGAAAGNPILLLPSEVAAANAFNATPVAAAIGRLGRADNPDGAGSLRPALEALLLACRR